MIFKLLISSWVSRALCLAITSQLHYTDKASSLTYHSPTQVALHTPSGNVAMTYTLPVPASSGYFVGHADMIVSLSVGVWSALLYEDNIQVSENAKP